MGLENKPYFLPVIWTEFAVGTLFVFLRFFVRFRTVRWKGLRGDDLFAVLAEIFFIMDMVVMHCAYLWGTNAEFTQDELENMTSDQLRTISNGSKITFIGWFSYPLMLYCMKGVMVFFYWRLTKGLWQERVVKWLGIVIVLTYVGVLLTVTCSCLPIPRNWQAWPSPGPACTGHVQNIVTLSICNIATDVALLCVPIPLLWALRKPAKEKIITGLFLCSGVFVITTASIRLGMTYSKNPSTVTMNLWGTLETSSAMVAVNATVLRPLFTRRFWGHENRSGPHGRVRRHYAFPKAEQNKRRGLYSTKILESDGTTLGNSIAGTSTMAGTTVIETEIERVRSDLPVQPYDSVDGTTASPEAPESSPQPDWSGDVEKLM